MIQADLLYFAEANHIRAVTEQLRRGGLNSQRDGGRRKKKGGKLVPALVDAMTIVDSVELDDFRDLYSPFSALPRVSAEILRSASEVGKREG